MQIWLITDGEKEGPFLDFEIRSRIQSGELSQDQKVWHSDLDGWTPLGEVDLFAHEFEKKSHIEEQIEEEQAELASLEKAAKEPRLQPVMRDLHLWRRFGARWFDYLLYMTLLLGAIVLARVDFFALSLSPWFPFVSLLPWIFLESISLSFWGTTPGKWLAGLRVRNAAQDKLSSGQSILRSMRVVILGMGFGPGIFLFLCHGISAWLGFKKKIVLWDTPVGTEVNVHEPKPEKWVGFGLGIAGLLSGLMGLSFLMLMNVNVDSLPADVQEKFRQTYPFVEGLEKATK